MSWGLIHHGFIQCMLIGRLKPHKQNKHKNEYKFWAYLYTVVYTNSVCNTLSKTYAFVSTKYTVLLCKIPVETQYILIATIFFWIVVSIAIIFLNGFSYLNHNNEFCLCTDIYTLHPTNYEKIYTWNPNDMHCQRFGLSTFRFVDVLVFNVLGCRHLDQLPTGVPFTNRD